jgi:acetyltransferase
MLARSLSLCSSLSGSGFALRPIQPFEGEALQDHFRRLSSEARYYRLLGGASELPASELARALGADGFNTLTLVLVHRAAIGETIIGEARVAHSHAERTCEFAMSIAGEWRRLGLGSALLSAIENLAVESDMKWLFGDVLRSNAAMIALARGQGFGLETGVEARLVQVRKGLSDSLLAASDGFICAAPNGIGPGQNVTSASSKKECAS